MTTLTLVAHALTPALRGLVLGGDAEPDPASIEAARGLKFVADDVYAGPETAAQRTADALGLTATIEPVLRDRDYGDWNGQNLENLLAADPTPVSAWLERPHTAPPGGESANDLITRLAHWLSDLPQPETERHTVVAVVHPTVVRAMVLYALEAPAESLRHIDVRPLSTVHLTEHSGAWSLTFA